jgi:putative transcriptional regulator
VAESLAGKLLVSSLRIVEPTFARTVILICAHDENGALGVVLNRPLEGELVANHLPGYAQLAAEPPSLFSGGPVETSAALALGRWKEPLDIPPPRFIFERTSLLDLSRPIEELAPNLVEARVFAGYSGWTGGQLEEELKEESWFVVPATTEDVFSRQPATLWRDVLRRQQGKLAMFAFAPRNPGVN